MLTKRAHILFDENIWRKLVTLAKVKKISVADLVRDAIEKNYTKDLELVERRKVLEDIEKIRPAPFKGKIDYKELINYGRK